MSDTENKPEKQEESRFPYKPQQFKPGQSGNPAGRPKRQSIMDLFYKALDEHPEHLKAIGESLVLGLAKREPAVLREILSRTDPENAPDRQTIPTVVLDAPAIVAEAGKNEPAKEKPTDTDTGPDQGITPSQGVGPEIQS